LAIREALAPARSSLWSEDQIQEAEDEVRELEPGSVSEVAVGDVLVSIERDDEGDYVPLGGSFCTDVVDGRDLQISEGEPGRYDE
jgi:hypothetical protein